MYDIIILEGDNMNIVIKIILSNTLLLVEISLSNNKKYVPKNFTKYSINFITYFI